MRLFKISLSSPLPDKIIKASKNISVQHHSSILKKKDKSSNESLQISMGLGETETISEEKMLRL